MLDDYKTFNTKKSFDNEETNVNSWKSFSECIKDTINHVKKARKSEIGIIGVPSGFKDVDIITSGWQSADFIIIAAQPANGLNAYALSIAKNAAVDYNVPVAFFSLNKSAKELVTRLISMESEIVVDKIRRGKLTENEMTQIHSSAAHLEKAPLYFDDTFNISVLELREKALQLKNQHNIQLFIIDHLQLLQLKSEPDKEINEMEKSSICRLLKKLAKELSIPIIVLTELDNVIIEKDGNFRPKLSDLEIYGSIEQYADVVQFIYRPVFYKILEDEDGCSTDGLSYVLTLKNRNGETGDVRLQNILKYSKFQNIDSTYFSMK